MTQATENGSPGSATQAANTSQRDRRRRRPQRPFPASSFEDALVIADAIQRFGGGHPKIRRLTLFEQLERSPDSGLSRQQVTNSGRYGLTTGGYQAEFLELTKTGALATSPDASPRDRTRARFDLAIGSIQPFHSLYETFKDHKLPAQQVMRDHLVDAGLPEDEAQECVELFIVNAKSVGLLRPVAGTERVLSIEHVLDELPGGISPSLAQQSSAPARGSRDGIEDVRDLATTCFYITPIGDEDTEERKHADVFLGHVVEPAIEALGLDLAVIRADHIDKPGLITTQVIQHVVEARLVVADLSFHNPNVFYELALRHATGKPTVHICRSIDRNPFDLADVRTIRIDVTDIHSFVTQTETWRAELTNQARQALEAPEVSSNPLTAIGAAVLQPQQG